MHLTDITAIDMDMVMVIVIMDMAMAVIIMEVMKRNKSTTKLINDWSSIMEEKNLPAQVDKEDKIDIISLLIDGMKCFRMSWWLLLLLLILGAGVGFWKIEKNYSPYYEASASFVVTAGVQDNIISSSYYNKVSAEQLNATFPYILTSSVLKQVVAKDLGLGGVPGSISAQMVGDTSLFQINVISGNPQMAYDILQSVVKNYPTVAKYVIGNTQLKLLDETGIPTEPKNPRSYKRSIAMGMLGGFLIYSALLFFWTVTRHTIKNKDDLKKYLNLKYLGGIPLARFKRRSRENTPQILVDNPAVPNIYAESLETLQVRLAKTLREKQWQSFLVTSAMAGEGKTTTACNIALILAQKGYRTLLIDCDLRNPSVAEHLQLDNTGGGLCDILSGKEKPENIIGRYKDTHLYVLPGGEPVSRIAGLFSDKAFGELIQHYKKEMDYIVVDTPPCTFMHDTSLIAPCMDTGLMVIRQDYAHVNKIISGVESLSQAGLTLAGCTINGEATGIGSYGYGKYGYGRYGYGRYGYGRYGRYGRYGYYGKYGGETKEE